MFKLSQFNISVDTDTHMILKNTRTGGVIRFRKSAALQNDRQLTALLDLETQKRLAERTGIFVPEELDEASAWKQEFLTQRNERETSFNLYFVPSLNCQLACHYCFERGSDRTKVISQQTMDRFMVWLEAYFSRHSHLKTLRLSLFGGEPLLQMKSLAYFLPLVSTFVKQRGLNFIGEILSNGELLTSEKACFLKEHGIRRLQITLDGPREIHDVRRPRKHGQQPTFDAIISNLKQIIAAEIYDKVDLRISFDLDNSLAIPELLTFLVREIGTAQIVLSLGLTTPTLEQPNSDGRTFMLVEEVLKTWRFARDLGFAIPEDFKVGPWCVAVAKHSIALQPDGKFQKCFCTSGRPEFNFSDCDDQASVTTQDPYFENFDRTQMCAEEKCELLPYCGGGCYHDAIVKAGDRSGSLNRFCQKNLLWGINRGLLKLHQVPPKDDNLQGSFAKVGSEQNLEQ